MHRVNVNVIIGVVKEEENFMFKFNNIDKKKQEKGITLVALVVTIVVLLQQLEVMLNYRSYVRFKKL